jgi:hypothetical protein
MSLRLLVKCYSATARSSAAGAREPAVTFPNATGPRRCQMGGQTARQVGSAKTGQSSHEVVAERRGG